jgi:hypothetical protein
VAAVTVALVPACSDDGDPSAFCAKLRDLQPFDEAFTAAFSSRDRTQAEESLDAAIARFDRIAADAPGSVGDDMELLSDVLHDVREGLDDTDPDRPFDAFNAVGPRLARVEAASRRVSDYAREECGVDLDREATTTTETTVVQG